MNRAKRGDASQKGNEKSTEESNGETGSIFTGVMYRRAK